MARPLRLEVSNGWYHLTARGNERKPIFRTDRDRHHFLELLAEFGDRFGQRVHAYQLMNNHYHLLVETPQPNLSQSMHWLGVSYSVWFNRKHRRVGHLFQGRFTAVIFSPDEAALELSRYVHLNSVRVGRFGLSKQERHQARIGAKPSPDPELVRARLEHLREYRWSSYRAFTGLELDLTPPLWGQI